MKRLRTQQGTSLIEVVSALVLFTVVATGLSTSVASNISLNRTSNSSAAALALVQDKFEQIRMTVPVINTVPADLTIGTHNDPISPMTAKGEPNGSFTRTWTVASVPQYYNGSVVGARPGMVQVSVSVTWTDSGTRSVTAVTYACITPTCG